MTNKTDQKTILDRLSVIEKEVKDVKEELKKLPQLLAQLIQSAQQTINQQDVQQVVQQAIHQAIQQAVLQPAVHQVIEQAVLQTIQHPNLQQIIQHAVSQQATKYAQPQTLQPHQGPQEQLRQQAPSKEITIFVLRDESAKTCCAQFSNQLQSYLNELFAGDNQKSGLLSWWYKSEKPGFAVKEVHGIDGIDKEGIVLICGYSSSVRLDAGSMIYLRDQILRKNNSRVELVVFRFGDSASPAKVVDERERDKQVSCHSIYFISEGLILNAQTTNAIKSIISQQ